MSMKAQIEQSDLINIENGRNNQDENYYSAVNKYLIVKQIPPEDFLKDNIQKRQSYTQNQYNETKNLTLDNICRNVEKIGRTHAQYTQSILQNSSDISVFIKHSDIQDQKLRVSLDFIRDFNNDLKLLSEQQFCERYEKIQQDTLDQICKFHNIQRQEVINNISQFKNDKRHKVVDINIQFQIMIVCELWLNHQIYEPKIQTGIITNYELSQSIEFPIRICDLTPNSHIGITIYDLSKPSTSGPLASTMIDVFDSKSKMRQGTLNLFLWKNKELDIIDQTTPGLFKEFPKFTSKVEDYDKDKSLQNFVEINKLIQKIDFYQKVEKPDDFREWIDRHSYEATFLKFLELYQGCQYSFIEITFPSWPYAILYQDQLYNDIQADYIIPEHHLKRYKDITQTKIQATELKDQNKESYFENLYQNNPNKQWNQSGQRIQNINLNNNQVPLAPQNDIQMDHVTLFVDHQIMRQIKENLTLDLLLEGANPQQWKYLELTREVSESVAREIRPKPSEEIELNKILDLPDFLYLNDLQKTLIFKFRYSLVEKGKGLVKFLQSARLDDEKTQKEAMKIFNDWDWQQIGLEDALPFLSVNFAANKIYNKQINDNQQIKSVFVQIRAKAIKCLDSQTTDIINSIMLQLVQAYRYENLDKDQSELEKFFFRRVFENPKIANSFHWLVHLEKENSKNNDTQVLEYYKNLYDKFIKKLELEYNEIYQLIQQQLDFRKNTLKTAKEVRNCLGDKKVQKDLLKQLITNGKDNDLTDLNDGEGVPLSADLNITLLRCIPEKVSVFTSNARPLLLPFEYIIRDANPPKQGNLTMMFKTGDDMRQDQLVCQIFQIIDQLLLDQSIDLKFTTYNLIAFTVDDGLLQFVPDSKTITQIKTDYNKSIEAYLREKVNDENEFLIKLDNYIRSCAGYCIATYLLGIGDRHLENLMIDKEGKFFHIDFGFIFGKEPGGKGNLASKIRISTSMIEAMGGQGSDNFKKFLDKSVEAFKILKNHMSYILNLMHLMINSGMQDLPEQTHQIVLKDLYNRFMPEKSSQEIEVEVKKLIMDCINHKGAEIIEFFHNVAQKGK